MAQATIATLATSSSSQADLQHEPDYNFKFPKHCFGKNNIVNDPSSNHGSVNGHSSIIVRLMIQFSVIPA